MKKVLVIGFWLILWQVLSVIISEEILLVSPLSAFKKLLELMGKKSYWMAIFSSLSKILLGLFLSIFFGIAMAIISFLSPIFKELTHPMISFFRSIPVASFVIFLLVWINSAYLSIYISFFMGMPIIFENVYQGIVSVDEKLIEMLDSFNVGSMKRFKYIYKVKVLPYLQAGIMTASGLIFKSAVAAEIIGLQINSIGENLYNSKIYLNMPELFAWTITILILSMIFEKAIEILLGDKNAGI
jgi:NitT/TauT family transport system permease protein